MMQYDEMINESFTIVEDSISCVSLTAMGLY